MKNHLFVAGLAGAILIPSMAFAQQTCEQRSANRTAGTVVGAGIGALVGSAIAGHGDKTTGAVIGGVGGAIAGNQIAKGPADCAHAYGYYDNAGAWHASNVSRAAPRGYYDRQGQWVDGAPNGSYDRDGRWVRANTNGQAAGYTDSRGHWVPSSATGYYGTDGRYVAVSNSGNAPMDVAGRSAWLDQSIHRGLDNGVLSRRDGHQALRRLAAIERDTRGLRTRSGALRPRDQQAIMARLDDLTADVRQMRRGADRYN